MRVLLAALATFGLLSCTDGQVDFPVTQEDQSVLSDDVHIVLLTDTNIAQFAQPTSRSIGSSPQSWGRAWEYRVGVGDKLNIVVFDHPELSLLSGEGAGAVGYGYQVRSDGQFFFPFIGQVEANGRAPESIRSEVAERLAEFVPSPQVELQVSEFNSQWIVVAGEVQSPNRQSLTTAPLTLIEAINSAGDAKESADLQRVSVQRNGASHRFNLQRFLERGELRSNPVLRAGDIVNVPQISAASAYLLGEVGTQAIVDLSSNDMSLTHAIAANRGLEQARADARGIFVFREGSGGSMNVYQLDISVPTGLLLGTKFMLRADDVIYVVRSPLTRWNDTISSLLPTVRAAAAVETLAQ